MTDREKDTEIYYLKRDLEKDRLKSRDLTYEIYRLRRQRIVLIGIVIIQALVVLFFLLKTSWQ